MLMDRMTGNFGQRLLAGTLQPPPAGPPPPASSDGDEIDDATLAEIRADIWNSCVALALETGDVVVVDSFLTGHGHISWDPSVQRRMLLQHFT